MFELLKKLLLFLAISITAFGCTLSESGKIAKKKKQLDRAVQSVKSEYGYTDADYAVKECLGFSTYDFYRSLDPYPASVVAIEKSLDCVRDIDEADIVTANQKWRGLADSHAALLKADIDIRSIVSNYRDFSAVSELAHDDSRTAKERYRKLKYCQINPQYRIPNKEKLWKVREVQDKVVIMNCVNEVHIADVMSLFDPLP